MSLEINQSKPIHEDLDYLLKDNTEYHTQNEMVEKAIEETSELLMELIRLKHDKGDMLELASEMADVENCVDQLKAILDIERDVKTIRLLKMNRQRRRNECLKNLKNEEK